jgi:hypothetical protein
MGRQNEGLRVDSDGSVRNLRRCEQLLNPDKMMCRMAAGLGMSQDEWKDLRGQVDDSFWVMRAIGKFNRKGYLPLYD